MLWRRSASLIRITRTSCAIHDHLAVVLRLRLLAALELNSSQLGDALDELGDLVAELGADLLDVGFGVLDDIVQERGGDRPLIESQLGAYLGRSPRVVDEVLARAPLLALVLLGGEAEGAPEQLPVDFRVIGRDVGDELVDQLVVPLTCFENRHGKSVLPAFRVSE